jgi:hypothetical protein
MGSPYAHRKLSQLRHHVRAWGPGLFALAVLLPIYAGTLQYDVNGSSHDYLLDAGEIQVALNLWGTIHYTGYPHYTVLSAALTQVGRAAGLAPAAAASATSLVWSCLALLVVYRLLCHIVPRRTVVSGLAILALGLVETWWMHSVIAEVYSFSLLLVGLAALLGMRLRRGWQPHVWLAWVGVLGTAVGHHRVLLLILPMMGVLVGRDGWSWLRRHPRYILYACLAFLAPFLVYLYLPLRAWQGATWVYGDPGTWPGLWQQFAGCEVWGDRLRLPQTVQAWLGNLRLLSGHVTRQLPWAVVMPGILGLFWLARERLHVGLALLVAAAAFPLFGSLMPQAVWAPAVLMPFLLCVTLGIAYLLHRLTQRRRALRPIAWAGLVSLSGFLFYTNLPFVHHETRDPTGRTIITALQAIPTDDQFPCQEPVVTLPWGTGFFAAAYGLHVSHELPSLDLVDHTADYQALMRQKGSILTPGTYLCYWPPGWWEGILGPVCCNAVAPGVVAMSKHPPYQNVPLDVDFRLGNGIRIRFMDSCMMDEEKVRLGIYWEAMQPIREDYRVAVHLVTCFPPEGPDDIIAQADAIHPVQGWYPTTRWAVGEVVRDQYELTIPEGTDPSAVQIAMYTVDDKGGFENSEWYVIMFENRQ